MIVKPMVKPICWSNDGCLVIDSWLFGSWSVLDELTSKVLTIASHIAKDGDLSMADGRYGIPQGYINMVIGDSS